MSRVDVDLRRALLAVRLWSSGGLRSRAVGGKLEERVEAVSPGAGRLRRWARSASIGRDKVRGEAGFEGHRLLRIRDRIAGRLRSGGRRHLRSRRRNASSLRVGRWPRWA